MSVSVVSGFLAIPRPGERTLEALEKKLDLLVLQTLLVQPPERAGRHARAFARLQHWLEAIAKSQARAALRRAMSSVDVRAPVLGLRSGALDAERALASAVPALLCAFANALEHGTRVDDLLWDVPFERLIDAEAGRVFELGSPACGLYFDGSVAQLRTASGEHVALSADRDPEPAAGVRLERPFHRITEAARPVLGLADGNPLAMHEEHPDKGGNRLDLGERSLAEWQRALAEAVALLEVALPALHAEIARSLQRIVPVGFEPERHLSASYREAPGLIYLTLHPSVLTLAEAIVHETQHGKLNVLRWFDPVLSNADSTWTQSPVRPDLRPLAGVLLAVHAFVPVAVLHQRLADLGHPLAQTAAFARRRGEVLAGNATGLATLRELGRPTAIGAQVIDALEDLQRFASEAAPPAEPGSTLGVLG